MPPLFAIGQTVRLQVNVTRRRDRKPVTLAAGSQYTVRAVTDYAGSPEYTLRDEATGDVYLAVPWHCLEAVDATVPAAAFESGGLF